jgi:hypothetical protein
MTAATIKRSGKTNQFIIEMRDGLDTSTCAEQTQSPVAWLT